MPSHHTAESITREKCRTGLCPHRKSAQHQGVDQTEDSGVGADAERKGEDGPGRKARIPSEPTDSVL